MHFHRTAERAARAVYGTIIALAVIAALEGGPAGAVEVLAAVIGGVMRRSWPSSTPATWPT